MALLGNLPRRATIYEVGPRDGLQNEARMVATADKIAFVNALARTGLRFIEITSFVNPKWIPQLADAVEVARGVERPGGVAYSALVPNRRGLEAAIAGGMKEIAVFLSASETHNRKNVNKTIAETLAAFAEVVEPARAAGVRVRAYVSTVYGCPYEGEVDPRRAVELTRALRQLGVYQVSLGDTVGVANPALFTYECDPNMVLVGTLNVCTASNIKNVYINLQVQSARRDIQTQQFRQITVRGMSSRQYPSR